MKKINRVYILLIIIFIWGLGSKLKIWNSYIIPLPENVFNSSFELLKNGKLFNSIFISLKRVFIGFFISSILAIPLGIIFGLKNKLYNIFEYLFEFLRHVPPLAMVPMIILWFGIGETSKIVIIVLASFFPIFLNTLKGIQICDKKYIEVGKVFNLTKFQIFKKIIFPSAVPDIVLGLKLGIGYSWRAIIAAELIASSSGIGYLILDAQQISRSDIIVVGIISIGLFGIITEYIFSKISNLYLKKYKVEVKDE